MNIKLDNGDSQKVIKTKSQYTFTTTDICTTATMEGLNEIDLSKYSTNYQITVTNVPSVVPYTGGDFQVIATTSHEGIKLPSSSATFNEQHIAYFNYSAITVTDDVVINSQTLSWNNNILTIPQNTTDAEIIHIITFANSINNDICSSFTITQQVKEVDDVLLTVKSNLEGTATVDEETQVFSNGQAVFQVKDKETYQVSRSIVADETPTITYEGLTPVTQAIDFEDNINSSTTASYSALKNISAYKTYTNPQATSITMNGNQTVTLNVNINSHNATTEVLTPVVDFTHTNNSFILSKNNNIITITSPTSKESNKQNDVITVTASNLSNATINASLNGSGETYIVGYRLVINDFEYEDAKVEAKGGDAIIANKQYTVYAVYNTGTEVIATTHPQVIENYTLISGQDYANINNLNGTVTFAHRQTEVGGERDVQVKYDAYVTGYDLSGDTANATAIQELNQLETHILTSLDLHWDTAHTLTTETLTENGGTKQLYGRGIYLDTYTSTATANTMGNADITNETSSLSVIYRGLYASQNNVSFTQPEESITINISASTSTDGTNWIRQYPNIELNYEPGEFDISIDNQNGCLSIIAPTSKINTIQSTSITLSAPNYTNTTITASLSAVSGSGGTSGKDTDDDDKLPPEPDEGGVGGDTDLPNEKDTQ